MQATGGKALARRSANKLARRLRRQMRERCGQSRAAALSHRANLLRQALSVHWDITSQIGGHHRSLAEALDAAALIKLTVDDERQALRELQRASNWARHAPSLPGARLVPMLLASQGTEHAEVLEQYRGALYDIDGQTCDTTKEDVHSQRERQAKTDPEAFGILPQATGAEVGVAGGVVLRGLAPEGGAQRAGLGSADRRFERAVRRAETQGQAEQARHKPVPATRGAPRPRPLRRRVHRRQKHAQQAKLNKWKASPETQHARAQDLVEHQHRRQRENQEEIALELLQIGAVIDAGHAYIGRLRAAEAKSRHTPCWLQAVALAARYNKLGAERRLPQGGAQQPFPS